MLKNNLTGAPHQRQVCGLRILHSRIMANVPVPAQGIEVFIASPTGPA